MRKLCLGVALLCAALASAPASPATATPGLLDAAASARVVVVGRAGPTRSVDRHGRSAPVQVSRTLQGRPPTPLRVAWEDLAPRSRPRLPEGREVLLALDPLPGFSLWRERFPGGGPLVIKDRASALRVDPAPETVEALARFLALEPPARRTERAVPALVGLVRAPDVGLARDALHRLDGLPGLPAALESESESGAELAETVARVQPELGEAILELGARRRLRVLLSAAREASSAPGPLEAAGWRTRAAIEGSLPEGTARALLARDDPRLRAVGATWLRGKGREARLRALWRSDPDGGVRVAALAALGDGLRDAELVDALADADARVVQAALRRIVARGESMIAPLLASVEQKGGEDVERARAIAALARIPEAHSELERLARRHPDEKVRGFASLALGRLRTDPAHD